MALYGSPLPTVLALRLVCQDLHSQTRLPELHPAHAITDATVDPMQPSLSVRGVQQGSICTVHRARNNRSTFPSRLRLFAFRPIECSRLVVPLGPGQCAP